MLGKLGQPFCGSKCCGSKEVRGRSRRKVTKAHTRRMRRTEIWYL
ncbi:hypothetical protein SEA_BEUFFERT_240 [Streptomyces phage Beuffert]|nr:hypothetical protein SEA_BEUFFERT_240 [Streptomyces phage Beuffert]